MDTLSLIGYSLNACYATTVIVILLTFMFKVTEQNKNVNQQLTKIKKRFNQGDQRLQKILGRDAAGYYKMQEKADLWHDVETGDRNIEVKGNECHGVEATDLNHMTSGGAERWNYGYATDGESEEIGLQTFKSKLSHIKHEVNELKCLRKGARKSQDRQIIAPTSCQSSLQPDCRPKTSVKNTPSPKPAPKPRPVSQTSL